MNEVRAIICTLHIGCRWRTSSYVWLFLGWSALGSYLTASWACGKEGQPTGIADQIWQTRCMKSAGVITTHTTTRTRRETQASFEIQTHKVQK
jgi:hypothetical protein